MVYELVSRKLRDHPHKKFVIVSGGCPKGADLFAEEAARIYGLDTLIFPVPRNPPIVDKKDFRDRAFARNRTVVENCDVLYALVSDDRTGGTENTLEHCRELSRETFLIDSSGKFSHM